MTSMNCDDSVDIVCYCLASVSCISPLLSPLVTN